MENKPNSTNKKGKQQLDDKMNWRKIDRLRENQRFEKKG